MLERDQAVVNPLLPINRYARSLVLLLLACTSAQFALSSPCQGGEITDVSIGLGKLCKVNRWTPLYVTIAAGDEPMRGHLEALVADGEGLPVQFASPEVIHLAAGESKQVILYVQFGRSQSDLALRFVHTSSTRLITLRLARGAYPPPLSVDTKIMLTLGPSIGVEQALLHRGEDQQDERVLVKKIEALHQLPSNWFGYDAVDTLIISTRQVESLAKLSPDQREALLQWIRLGGHVFLCVGEQGEAIFGEAGILPELCPGDFQGVGRQRMTSGIESFADSSTPIDYESGAQSWPTTLIENPQGKIQFHEGQGEHRQPMAVRAAFGLGQIVLIAADLDQPPFSNWEGRKHLLARLLFNAEKRGEKEITQANGQASHLGFNDLAGQLRAALDHVDTARVIPFYLIALLMGLFILIVSVVDYFLVRRLRRWEWTWITFPAFVILFALLTWGITSSLRGEHSQINQVDIIDLDLEQQQIRGTTIFSLYSPRSQKFDIQIDPSPSFLSKNSNASLLLTSHALAGEGFGGSESQATLGAALPPYFVHANKEDDAMRASITAMPVRIGGRSNLVARWWASMPKQEAGNLWLTEEGFLSGAFSNPTDTVLHDCYLVFGRWYFEIGDLQPGESFPVSAGMRRRDLEAFLTKRIIEDLQEVRPAWDPKSIDLPRIVELCMFHKAAGGANYSGLNNNDWGFLDMSDLRNLNRAILVAKIEGASTIISTDPQSKRANDSSAKPAFFRIVFPVE